MGKIIPRVRFSVGSIADTFFAFHYLLSSTERRGWSEVIYRAYPDLKTELEGIDDKKKRERIERNFLEVVFTAEGKVLQEKAKSTQAEWDKINDRILGALSEVVEQDWSNDDARISGRITVNPMGPRYLETRTFDVFYRRPTERIVYFAIHEILHFIYFEKWETIFPKTPKEEFEIPHLIWALSEMMPGVVLNDERIQKVFKYKFTSNPEFEALKLDGKPLMSHIKELYDDRRDFEDFLRKSFKFVKAHEKEIKSLTST